MIEVIDTEINNYCNHVLGLKRRFTDILSNKGYADTNIIKQMRIIYGKALIDVFKFKSYICKHANNDNDYIKISTNESLLYIIHGNIRLCEKIAYDYASEKSLSNSKNSDMQMFGGDGEYTNNLSNYIDELDTVEANKLFEIHSVQKQNYTKEYIFNGLDIRKPTLLCIWANWCHFSNDFMKKDGDWEKFKKESNFPNLQIIDIDVDNNKELMDYASKINVVSYPSIILFTGDEICRFEEKRSVENLKNFVKENIKY